jgi:serine/threonine protein kinase
MAVFYMGFCFPLCIPLQAPKFCALLCCAQALHAIHASGVAHGDICADNIIVDEGGKVRIVQLEVAGET